MNLISAVLYHPMYRYNGDTEACTLDFIEEFGGRLGKRDSNGKQMVFVKFNDCFVDFNLPQRIFMSPEEYIEAIRKEEGAASCEGIEQCLR